LIKIVIV